MAKSRQTLLSRWGLGTRLYYVARGSLKNWEWPGDKASYILLNSRLSSTQTAKSTDSQTTLDDGIKKRLLDMDELLE